MITSYVKLYSLQSMQTLALGREKELSHTGARLVQASCVEPPQYLDNTDGEPWFTARAANTSSLLLGECVHFVEGFFKSGNVLCHLWLLAFLQDKPCTGVYSIHHTLDCFFLSRVLHGLRK